MATMIQESMDSEYDDVRFPQERTQGLILGLTLEQVIVVLAGVLIGMAFILRGGPAMFVGIGLMAVIGAFGATRFRGRSLPGWVWVATQYLRRGATDQLEYRQGMAPAHVLELVDGEPQAPVSEAGPQAQRDAKGRIKPGERARFRLPGVAGELMVYAMPNGAGFVWDPRAREAVVCAKVMTTRGFDLESFDAQEERSLSWGSSLAALSRLPGVVRIQASDQTTLISGAAVEDFYESKQEGAGRSGASVDPFLDQAFRELMKEAQSMPVHEQWLTLVVSPSKITSQVKALGGGTPALMEHMLKLMTTVESTMPRSGTQVTAWHSPRTLAGLSRSAFDPDASVMVSTMKADGKTAGTAPSSAGPMAVEVHAGHMVTDGTYHRTYKVSELPQNLARLGFLDELVFAGDFRHTVSVFMAPVERGAAVRSVQRRKTDWHTNSRLMNKLGRIGSLEHDQSLEDVEREEAELRRRHTGVEVVVLVTVTGASRSELESAAAEVVASGITAECELRPVWMEQDAAFVAGALPFGRMKL